MNEKNDSKIGNLEWNRLTVGQLVASYPRLAKEFEGRGIDYCCGGKRTLEEACNQKGIDVGSLIADLSIAQSHSIPTQEVDWGRASLIDLVDHIEATHHRFIRTEKPRLTTLAKKVARVHGLLHPELTVLAATVEQVFSGLDPHLEQEERIFFPACRRLEMGGPANVPEPTLIAGLKVLESEHLELGEQLESIRNLTSGFQLPRDACNSYLALFHGLEQLEADLHEHIHKENNILHARINRWGH